MSAALSSDPSYEPGAKGSAQAGAGKRGRVLAACALSWALVWLALVWRYYPSRVDPPEVIHFNPNGEQQDFYDDAFATRQARYAVIAQQKAQLFQVKESVQNFVRDHDLAKAHVLEIGSGEGSLQDVVDDYTGLDISATAKQRYRKRFVQADARAMPFAEGEFDAAWSVWVLEHVPNPEQALREMRRVLKPNGLLYLAPAWLCSDLAANGYPVRPYSDFGLAGKMIKATIPLQRAPLFEAAHSLPVRAARLAAWSAHRRPTNFHYRPITPNYRQYWMSDSDAVNSLDVFEAYLWFVSRGDQCLNCPSPAAKMLPVRDMPLVIRVKPR